MIITTILENDLVERKSDSEVLIRNTTTGHTYQTAIDLSNEKRIELGLQPYEYEETDIPIEPVEPIEEPSEDPSLA